MKILDFSGDNTGTLNFVVKLKDAEDGDQTFISKNRYIDKNTEPKLSHNDSHFFIHDTLLSHEDSDKP